MEKTIYGGKPKNPVAYCALHNGSLTVKEMKKKGCLGKQCHHLQKNEPERKVDMENLYYQMKDGRYIRKHELEEAFYIQHGYYRHKNETEFLKWLYSLLGKTITKVVREYDMQVKELAKSRPILAVMLYRSRYNCSLVEARDYVNSHIEKPV